MTDILKSGIFRFSTRTSWDFYLTIEVAPIDRTNGMFFKTKLDRIKGCPILQHDDILKRKVNGKGKNKYILEYLSDNFVFVKVTFLHFEI